jgi:hypothetical protein
MNASPEVFLARLAGAGLPAPVREYRFAPPRKWRFDWAWLPPIALALEVEGGVWTRGRHTRGAGFLKDCEKYNTATLLGWRVLRVTPATLCTDATLALLRAAMSARAAA